MGTGFEVVVWIKYIFFGKLRHMLVLLKIQTNISHSVMTHFGIDFAPEKQSSISPNWPIALLSKYSISTNKRSMKLTFSQQTLFRKRVVSISFQTRTPENPEHAFRMFRSRVVVHFSAATTAAFPISPQPPKKKQQALCRHST